MRWILALVVVAVAPMMLARPALATPKIAILPLEGDTSSGQLTDVVATEAAHHASVADSTKVDHTMSSLGIDSPSAKELKKLRAKLAVDAIVQGKVEKDGKRLRLELTISGRGAKPETMEIKFTKSSSKTFRAALREGLEKHIASAVGDDAPEPADEEDAPKKPKFVKTEKHDDDGDEVKTPAKVKPHRVAKREDDGDDEDRPSVSKHGSVDDDRASPHHPITQAAIWIDAGGAMLRRTLTYSHAGAGTPPPAVGTASASAQIEADVYPAALGSRNGSGFGFTGEVRKAFGLGIKSPGSTSAVGIDEATYTVGARYRFAFGDTSIAVGASYWRQRYVAAGTIDMPNVDYTAIAPGGEARFALGPKLGAFANVELPYVMSTGPAAASFGAKGGISVAVDAGVDFALAPHYGIRAEAIVDQVGLSFDAANATASMRGVSAATDRTMGVVATFAVMY